VATTARLTGAPHTDLLMVSAHSSFVTGHIPRSDDVPKDNGTVIDHDRTESVRFFNTTVVEEPRYDRGPTVLRALKTVA